jgi:hypothetical protein
LLIVILRVRVLITDQRQEVVLRNSAPAEMLKEDSDENLLQRLKMAAEAADPRYSGSIEAYEAANPLQVLLEKTFDISPYK